jgi:murein DD-endopeptidase MepM/ murein hydrolase activator NlpD
VNFDKFTNYKRGLLCDFSTLSYFYLMEQNEQLIALINKFENWAKKQYFSLKDLFPTINKTFIYPMDLSINSSWIVGEKEFNNLTFFGEKLKNIQEKASDKILAGGYLEKRTLYTSSLFVRKINDEFDRRNTHLGIDFWLPKNTPIHAILEGEVVCASVDLEHKGYGGLVILKHTIEDFYFYSLYGHLSVKSALKNTIGDVLKKDEKIAELGDSIENGDWVPHLHFQIMLTLLEYQNDFPGVAFESEIEIWKRICPNPNLLFKLEQL